MAAICEHCIQGHVLNGTPSGSFEGTAYFHPASTPGSKKAVVLLTDIFGLKLVNSKLIADQYSERLKCDVWVPDFFNGNPPIDESMLRPFFHDIPGTPTPFLAKLKFIWTIIKCLPGFIRNRSSIVDSRTTAFVKRLKEQKKYGKIGAVGFCFCGAQVIRLAGLFTSIAIAHPGRISKSQLEAINVPSSWICAEEDNYFGKHRAEAEAICKQKHEYNKLDYEFRDYKGTVHGFAYRPNLALPEIKKAFDISLEQGVAWFEKTLA